MQSKHACTLLYHLDARYEYIILFNFYWFTLVAEVVYSIEVLALVSEIHDHQSDFHRVCMKRFRLYRHSILIMKACKSRSS